ncbi:YlbG family protein [Carnobacterium sp. TMP28]|uniref:YlbG family protein n=1 Tax=Carnobacterium sp. TMP28 TaxID=3397060 RepID=UPI0039E0A617
MKTLKRFGLIHYVSKRMKYVVIYVNRTELETTIRKLKELHFVRQVEPSYRPLINMDFKEVLKKVTPRKEVEEVEEFTQLDTEFESQLIKNNHIIKEHEVRTS